MKRYVFFSVVLIAVAGFCACVSSCGIKQPRNKTPPHFIRFSFCVVKVVRRCLAGPAMYTRVPRSVAKRAEVADWTVSVTTARSGAPVSHRGAGPQVDTGPSASTMCGGEVCGGGGSNSTAFYRQVAALALCSCFFFFKLETSLFYCHSFSSCFFVFSSFSAPSWLLQ